MARRKKKNLNSKGRKAAIIALLSLIGALILVTCCAALNANTLNVMRAEVYVEDLPAAFEGVRLLYLTDIDLCGINTAKKSAAATARLQSLSPDMLILGGDYTSVHLLELLNRSESAQISEKQLNERQSFFQYISGFSAPLGRYAIITPDDAEGELLSRQMIESGFMPLTEIVPIERNGERIYLIPDSKIGEAAGSFSRRDCVICAAPSPESFPALMTAEAIGGGHVVDLALAGHTHGGQIRLFGKNVLSLTAREQQYLSGWSRETGVPMLTNSGLGCEGANLRIGSQAEAWIITLTAQNPEEEPQS